MLGLVIIFVIINLVTSNPTKNDINLESSYRLKKSFKPLEYTLIMSIPEDVLTNPIETIVPSTATGILFEWMNKTDRDLQFHADTSYLYIRSILLTDSSKIDFDRKKNCNEISQICTITLPETIPGLKNNTFRLTFLTDVLLSSGNLGMYRSSYETTDGKTEYFIATQFEPTYARRAFPCLDEPSFKSKFKFWITAPSDFIVQTNSKNKNRTFYEELPEMSTYLVAFVVSKFTSTHQAIGQDQTSHKVWSKPGLEEYRYFSWKAAPEIMDEFGKYLNKNFSSFGINKTDEIAVPNFGAAIENWGLITFSEDLLLLNEKENSSLAKQHTIKGLVHEIAHMWFGDWVTLEWWDVIFLNEGFAKYFEYFLTNKLYPEFEMDQQFVVDVLQLGLKADENPFSPALQSSCKSLVEINLKLMDGTSHFKAACIVKMLKDIMSEEQFQKGLQDYVKENIYVRPTDLWTRLQKYVKDRGIVLNDIVENWILEAGFPLIQVDSVDGKTVKLSQTNFRTGKASKWNIPILFETDKDKSSSYWLKDTLKISKNEQSNWVHLKNSEGFYRVNYDDQLWADLIKALPKKDSIDDLSKSQIVDDIFALGRARKMPYSKVLDYLDFLKTTDNYYIWKPAFRGFDFLLKRFEENSNIGKHIISLIEKKLPKFELKNTQLGLDKVKKSLEFEWQCRTGNKDAIKTAQDKFSSFLNDKQSMEEIDLREVVYCYGQKSEDDWEKLHQKYKTTRDSFTRQIILKSLACGNEKEQKALLKSIREDDKIQRQEKVTAFLAVLKRNVDAAVDFFVYNAVEIDKTYPPLSVPVVISALGDALTSESQIKKLANTEKLLSENSKQLLAASLQLAEKNLKWTEDVQKELLKYFGISSSNSLHFNLYLAAILFIFCLF